MDSQCDICYEEAEGEIEYIDGEILVACGACIIDISVDPAKPIHRIREYADED